MTARRAPAEKASPASHPTSQPAELCALGEALAARSEDCWAMCESRLEALQIEDVGTPEFRVRRRASQLLGAQIYARWLMTGKESTVEERTWLGGLGDLGAQTGVSIAFMTRGYLIFRDVMRSLIEEEAQRLETPHEYLNRAIGVNAQSADSSILWMTRGFDRQSVKQAAELAASEDRFRGVFASMATAVVLTDAEGVVVSCNEAAAEMLGIPAADLVGVNVCAHNPHYSDEQGVTLERVPIADVILTRQPIHGQVVKHDFGDGRPVRWHQVDSVPIKDAEGHLVQVLTTFSDITAVKQADAMRAESEAKDRFLAAVSHELRTPLNSILGFAQLLEAHGAGRLDEKQMRYVHNIARSGAGLLKLISDVLELSSSSGRPTGPLADVAVGPLAREVAAEFEPGLSGRAVDLVIDVRPGLKARADRGRLRQVLANLVSNASKFTSEGSITITARALDGRVRIGVADTGIGIPADKLDTVFTEFTQLDSGSTRAHGGVGLGLAVSRRLCELMGGSIRLESAAEGGVTATVELASAN